MLFLSASRLDRLPPGLEELLGQLEASHNWYEVLQRHRTLVREDYTKLLCYPSKGEHILQVEDGHLFFIYFKPAGNRMEWHYENLLCKKLVYSWNPTGADGVELSPQEKERLRRALEQVMSPLTLKESSGFLQGSKAWTQHFSTKLHALWTDILDAYENED